MCGDLEGAKFRKGPRGGLLKLAGASSFCLLLSGFLSRSRTLSPLPRSHPSLFPPLRLCVRSVVTSAEIPPNSSAQWRAGGRPSLLYAGRSRGEHSAWATAGGACRGDRRDGGGGPLGLRSEAQGPRRLRPGTEPWREARRSGDRGNHRPTGAGPVAGASTQAGEKGDGDGREGTRMGWRGEKQVAGQTPSKSEWEGQSLGRQKPIRAEQNLGSLRGMDKQSGP